MRKWYFLSWIIFASTVVFAQNVGIGTMHPTRARLEVHGVADNNSTTSAVFGGDGVGVSFQRGIARIGFNQYNAIGNSSGKFIGNGYAGIHSFYPQVGYMSFELMGEGMPEQTTVTTRIPLSFNREGKVMIGRSYADAVLTVSKQAQGSAAAFLGTHHASVFNLGPNENTYIRAGKDGGRLIINDIPNGKTSMHGLIGINTATPVNPLEIRQTNGQGIALINSSTFAYWDFSVIPNSGYLQLSYMGSPRGIFSSTNGSYTMLSDIRMKKAIRNLPSVLSSYMKLEPVSFYMSADTSRKKQIGFIAQQVKALFPELVTVTSQAANDNLAIQDLHTINYDMVPVLTIKAIQEQQVLIEQQQALITALKLKLAELTSVVQKEKN